MSQLDRSEENSLSIVEQFETNFLHGEVSIQIFKAEDLYSTSATDVQCKNTNCIFIKRAFAFSKKSGNPFVAINLGDSCICETSCYSNRYKVKKI